MSEHNDISKPGDEEIMERIESLLSTPLVKQQEAAGASVDSDSLYDFCAQLAATVPQADDEFRSELLARLLNALPEKNQVAANDTPASATGQISQNGRAAGRRSPGERDPQASGVLVNFFNNKRSEAYASQRRHQRGGRWGRAASFGLGLAGTAAILVMLVVMAATLKTRYDKSQGNRTPVAATTPAESLKLLPGIAPRYTLNTSGVQYMAWSPDGRVLATGFGNNVELWDGASGQLLRRIDVDNVSGLWWSPDGAKLAVGVRLFDASTGREVNPVPSNRAVELRQDAAWSPDGRMIASRSMPPLTGTTVPFPDWDLGSLPGPTAVPGALDGVVSLWDPATGNTARILKMPPLQDAVRNMISKLVWSSDGRYVAALYGDSSMGVWDANNGTVKLNLPRTIGGRLIDPPRNFEWSSKGHILTRLAGEIVELWDPDTGKRVGIIPYPSPPPVQPPTPIPTAVDPLHTPAPAERSVPIAVPTTAEGFTITPAPTVPYLSPTPSPTYVYEGQGYRLVAGLAWSPDGRTLATFDENNIRLWDPATGKQKVRMTGDAAIRKLAWSPDGGVLFSIEGNPSNSHASLFAPTNEYDFLNGTIRMWDPLSGKQLRSVSQDDLSDFLLAPGGRKLAVRIGTAVTIWSVDSQMTPGVDHFTPTALPSPAVVSTGTTSISNVAITSSPQPASATAVPVCGSWSVVPAITPAAVESELRSVSSLSPGYAWAVGYYSATARDQKADQVRGAKTLVMRWDGKQWTQVRSPDAGAGNNFLNGVVALAENDAWAVGYFLDTADHQQALALHWDGAQWSRVPVADMVVGIGNGNSQLNAVSGSAPDDVWAVGALGVQQTPGGQFTLILHWDGKTWSRVPSPSPGIEMNELTSVSAVSKNLAWAVGQYMQHFRPMGGGQGNALVLRWDGKDWKPVPNQFEGVYISSISATSAGSAPGAWIVGGYMSEGGGEAYSSRWSGTKWENVTLPQLGNVDSTGYSDVRASSLNGVVTLSPDDAWTVGSYNKGTTIGDWDEYTLTEHWDGTVWSQVPSPNLNPEKPAAALNAVAAISSTDLWAVGRSTSSQAPKALILRYSSPWCASPTPKAEGTVLPASTVAPGGTGEGIGSPAPVITPAKGSSVSASSPCGYEWRVAPDENIGPLRAVAALSANDVWAVGHTNSVPVRTLIKRWDGQLWTQVPSPSVGSNGNYLNAVAVLADNDAWAVGSYDSGSWVHKTLVLHWDGAVWRVVPAADLPSKSNILHALAVVAPDDIWAVGDDAAMGSQSLEGSRTLVEHWNGSAWAIVPSPNPGDASNTLMGVAAISAHDVWAVGSYTQKQPPFNDNGKTLTMHWDGKIWSQVPSPDVPTYQDYLLGVTAVSADDVWAVGGTNTGEGGDPLTMRWNGKAWSIVPSPTTQAHNGTGLMGVAALSPRDVWAVGIAAPMPYVLRWDGSDWKSVAVPGNSFDGRPLSDDLLAVSATSAGELWAVGSAPDGNGISGSAATSFVMRYSRIECGR